MRYALRLIVLAAVALMLCAIGAPPARADDAPAAAPEKLIVSFLDPEAYPEEMPESGAVGPLYDVSSTTGQCPPGATLSLSFAGRDVTYLGIDYLAVFHYNPASLTWSDLVSVVDKQNQTVSAVISELGIYTISAIETGDREPPTVRWVLPAEGQTITGETKLVVVPEDNVGVFSVDFYLNDDVIGTDLTGMDGVWGGEMDFSGDVSGTYTLKAEASDVAGNTGSATRQVVLQTEATAPQATVNAPTYDGQTCAVRVTGTATDADGEVWGLLLELDGTFFGEVEQDGGNWSCTLTDCSSGPGEQTLTIHAFDDYDNEGTATIAASLPLCEACLAADPDSPQLPQTAVELLGMATGGTGNVQYKFAVNDTTIQEYGTADTCTWTPGAPGTYTLKVWVREPAGAPEVTREIEYAVAGPLTKVALTADPASPQPVNSDVLLTAVPQGGANVDYEFAVWDGVEWNTIREYTNLESTYWTPSKAGEHTLKVSAREIGSGEVFTDVETYLID